MIIPRPWVAAVKQKMRVHLLADEQLSEFGSIRLSSIWAVIQVRSWLSTGALSSRWSQRRSTGDSFSSRQKSSTA
jgi:hypothetical protein